MPIATTSAISNVISAVAGSELAVRTDVGPAWPRILPAPSMSPSSATMRMSSIVETCRRERMLTLGRSPIISELRRSADWTKIA
jgi:hypothetical protein